MGRPVFLLAWAGGGFHLHSLLVYIAYAWSTNGLTAGAIGRSAAAKLFRRQERGLELFLRHPLNSRRVERGHSFSCRGQDQVAYDT